MPDENFVPPYEILPGAEDNRPGDHNHPDNWSTPPAVDDVEPAPIDLPLGPPVVDGNDITTDEDSK